MTQAELAGTDSCTAKEIICSASTRGEVEHQQRIWLTNDHKLLLLIPGKGGY